MKILIVEDNEIKRDLIIKTINESYSNINIETCENTISAKKVLRKDIFDMLILDLNLPDFEDDDCNDKSGMLLFNEISRSNLYNKPAEIVILTSYEDLKKKYDKEIQQGLFNIIKYDSSEEEWKIALKRKINYIQGYKDNIENKKEPISNNGKLLFISHSSEDIPYVKKLVNILESIGFNTGDKLFCSSLPGYNIPTGENIYDYLKKQFDKDIHVICLLSENYYSSAACMNEMGATWVKSKKSTAILVPGFKYSQIKGSIDASRVWLNMNEKDRINDLKESLIEEFGLSNINSSLWQSKLDEYIKEVEYTYKENQYRTKEEQVFLEDIIEDDDDKSIKCILRFINKSNETKKCKNLDIKIEDSVHRKISFKIDYLILKSYIFYKDENKRKTIVIDKNSIEGIDNFNIYDWTNYDIKSSWTSSF